MCDGLEHVDGLGALRGRKTEQQLHGRRRRRRDLPRRGRLRVSEALFGLKLRPRDMQAPRIDALPCRSKELLLQPRIVVAKTRVVVT